MNLTLHTRPIDAGNGLQIILAQDGIIVHQRLVANRGGCYTGDGNPDLVGKPVAAMRGMGFRKTQPPRSVVAAGQFHLGLMDDYNRYVRGAT